MNKSKVTVELNRTAVGQLLKSQEVQNLLQSHADKVQEAAGDGYETSMIHGKNRCWVTIQPATTHAYYSNLKHNTLLKALGSVGGG